MMKPKFHLGDRVTVIKPYVAPVPDDMKDSKIFNDLYKLFGLDKDPRGVKPGDTYTIIEAESKPRTRSDGKTIYTYSYQGKSGKRSGFVLWKDEIKLVEAAKPAPEVDDDEEPDTVTIKIEVSLDDKAEAHRIAHKAVELAFKSYAAITKAAKEPVSITWTDDEIAAARKKVVELSSRVTEQGGDMIFQRSGDTVTCVVYTSSFDDESAAKGYAKPFDHDPFNEWIGKCVAACKAMGEPIPSFITHKNTKQDAA